MCFRGLRGVSTEDGAHFAQVKFQRDNSHQYNNERQVIQGQTYQSMQKRQFLLYCRNFNVCFLSLEKGSFPYLDCWDIFFPWRQSNASYRALAGLKLLFNEYLLKERRKIFKIIHTEEVPMNKVDYFSLSLSFLTHSLFQGYNWHCFVLTPNSALKDHSQ